MYSYQLTKEALRFLQRIPAKHAKQIRSKIEQLALDPANARGEELEWFPTLKRIKSGEYRVIYSIENDRLCIHVLRMGKRNDGEVYRGLQSLLALR